MQPQPLWKQREMIRIRMRVKYWAQRLQEGREDSTAITLYTRYSTLLEEMKAAHRSQKEAAREKRKAVDDSKPITNSKEEETSISFEVLFP